MSPWSRTDQVFHVTLTQEQVEPYWEQSASRGFSTVFGPSADEEAHFPSTYSAVNYGRFARYPPPIGECCWSAQLPRTRLFGSSVLWAWDMRM